MRRNIAGVHIPKLSNLLLVLALALTAGAAADQTLKFNFSSPGQAVQLASTETPGKWYVDRYPPCTFVSPATAPDGQRTLEEAICAADSQESRPLAYSGSFYNTQGRKYDLPAQTSSMTISLYVPSAWATTNARIAGFWGTAFNTSNNVSDYPIIEFQGAITSGNYPNKGVPGFYGWNNTMAAFDPIGLPAGFSYDTWVQLTVTLVAGNHFQYTVSDGLHNVSISSPFSDNTDSSLGYVALEGYNYGNDYSIFWDNLSAVFKR